MIHHAPKNENFSFGNYGEIILPPRKWIGQDTTRKLAFNVGKKSHLALVMTDTKGSNIDYENQRSVLRATSFNDDFNNHGNNQS